MKDVNWDEASRGMDVENKVDKFLKVVEKTVETVFKKKANFNDEDLPNTKPKNKIPKEVRLLMRQKKISDRILKSRSWMKTYTLKKQLEEKEIKLKQKYNTRKLKLESEAI